MIYESRNLGNVVEHYIRARAPNAWPVSTSAAVRAIRAVVECHVSDRLLENLIAQSAVRHGQNVHFDLYEGPPVRPVAEQPGAVAALNDNG